MVKYTRTIRRQIADELFECVWPFYEIGAKRDNIFFTYVIFWLILKYNMVFKKWWKKHCATLKKIFVRNSQVQLHVNLSMIPR